LYPETKKDRKWYELDDFTERLHGTEADDDVSPHDSDVVDAPEDMKRVGNDHEELHNAKLAPDGYYNGFHHKDYEGNYSQKKSHARHHKGHRLHRNTMVQIGDHEKDTDDMADEDTFVSYEHEDDTEDISELVDNKFNEFVQINPINQGLLYLDTQISYEHEDDTDSIPEGHAGNVIGDGMNLA
jgi:hypothetical protein